MAFVYWIRLPEHSDIFSEGYVGFTSKTVSERYKSHKTDSKRDRYSHIPFYKAMNKYKELLIVETICEGSNDYCLMIENKLRPSPNLGWNLLVGGAKGSLGTKASEETRRKQSESRKGERNHFYGKKHSEATKALMKIKNSRPVSEETRKKLSEIRKGKKLNLSPEQRKARSERSKNQKMTEAARKKMSEKAKGKYVAWRHSVAGWWWLIAEDIHDFILNNQGSRKSEIFKNFNIPPNSGHKILEKLLGGWNPYEDEEYQKWKIEKMKEAV